MRSYLLKYYLITFCLCSNLVVFAQTPGSGDGSGGLEGPDAPAAPIDNYLWVLALIGLIYVFLRLKATNVKNLHR
jgi:hypothetical protein